MLTAENLSGLRCTNSRPLDLQSVQQPPAQRRFQHLARSPDVYYTQDGTQRCNYCLQLLALHRYAHRTQERLRTLRQRLRNEKKEQILEQVRTEILDVVASRGASSCQTSVPRQFRPNNQNPHIAHRHEANRTTTDAPEPKTGAASSSADVQPDTATPRQYMYICPHCSKSIQSTVAIGRIYHRHAAGCGKKFRVANGFLAGRTHAHTCPTCNAVVHSTKASGRIQVTHWTPNGKLCRTNHWHVQG